MGRQGKRKEVFEDVKKKQMEVWQEIQDLMEKRSESWRSRDNILYFQEMMSKGKIILIRR